MRLWAADLGDVVVSVVVVVIVIVVVVMVIIMVVVVVGSVVVDELWKWLIWVCLICFHCTVICELCGCLRAWLCICVVMCLYDF